MLVVGDKELRNHGFSPGGVHILEREIDWNHADEISIFQIFLQGSHATLNALQICLGLFLHVLITSNSDFIDIISSPLWMVLGRKSC